MMRDGARARIFAAVVVGAGATGACGHGNEGGGRRPVTQAEGAPTEERGQELANDIMAQWQRQHPDREWVSEQHEKHVIQEPVDNSALIGQGQGATYGQVTAQDIATWQREVQKAVAEGSRIFHSADELGSPVDVSCDMCHPDAANTHPETYPKFQVEMGRVALLRDMINWCVQQPLRAEPLEPDGPKMRALEAYIYAQRKGTPLGYGRR